jgi:hypothetical protein
MGSIKFEVDIPDFEKEISIELIIRRDGEVVCKSSPTSSSNKGVEKEVKKTSTKPTTTNSSVGGNMMNADF